MTKPFAAIVIDWNCGDAGYRILYPDGRRSYWTSFFSIAVDWLKRERFDLVVDQSVIESDIDPRLCLDNWRYHTDVLNARLSRRVGFIVARGWPKRSRSKGRNGSKGKETVGVVALELRSKSEVE